MCIGWSRLRPTTGHPNSSFLLPTFYFPLPTSSLLLPVLKSDNNKLSILIEKYPTEWRAVALLNRGQYIIVALGKRCFQKYTLSY